MLPQVSGAYLLPTCMLAGEAPKSAICEKCAVLLVPLAGLEPARSCEQQILSPLGLFDGRRDGAQIWLANPTARDLQGRLDCSKGNVDRGATPIRLDGS